MLKDAMRKNETAGASDADLAALKANFPGCFTKDGAFDLAAFARRIRSNVDVTEEGYQLDFLGKNYARLLANEETETVIVPDAAHNAKPENAKSQNVYISGDNLDALKHLLRSYEREVKCIYIDPPYNTGSDGFVYNDNFKFKPDELVRKLSIGEDEAKKLLSFVGRGSASHSAWLMFMYPRLQLAKSLLRDDGVIFISIDDNEQANLKLLCDDVFGEQNFIGNIIWESTTQPDNIGGARFNFQKKAEYIALYARRKDSLGPFILESQGGEKKYPHEGKFGKCRFEVIERSYEGAYARDTMRFDILGQPPRPGKQWQIGQELARELEKKGRLEIVDGIVKRAVYPEDEIDEKSYKPFWSIFPAKEVGTSLQGKALLKEYLGPIGFDTVKPVDLMKKCFGYLDKTGIFVDFFSGSGTTAESIMRANMNDAGTRRYIMVQIDEECRKGSTAEQAGYKTIDQIGRARIEKAAEKIRGENPLLAKAMDLGFRHYTLARPSGEVLEKIEAFDPKASDLGTQDMLKEFGEETVLATWLNHDGYGLTAAAEPVDLGGYVAFRCRHHLYFIRPFDMKAPSAKALKALMERYETDTAFTPDKIVLFGYSFGWKELEELETNVKKLKTSRNLTIDLDIRH
jgi:adenine-specific DNA-methyltransferase